MGLTIITTGSGVAWRLTVVPTSDLFLSMHKRPFTRLAGAMSALAVFCFLSNSEVFAQWGTDSTHSAPVCVATNIQWNPKICTDEAEGAIVVWEDLRSGADYDIYAQRLDPNGRPMWAVNGVKLATNSFDQRFPVIASDGAGGAYVVWQDKRTGTNGIDLYAQHVKSDGTLAYPAAGLGIAVAVNDQTNPSICSDNSGNAWVVWEDNRATSTATRPDIYMNKLLPTSANWGTAGTVVTNQGASQHRPKVTDDGNGGIYVAWENNAKVPTSVYVNRFSASGASLWNSGIGVLVYTGDDPAKNARNIAIRRDGTQLMMAWEETSVNSTDGQNIMAQRIRSDSTKVWFSPAEVTGDWYGDQTMPRVFSDDSAGLGPNAGMLVLFQDYESNAPPYYFENDVAMVRILPDGGNRMPKYSDGFYYIAHSANGQTGFKAEKVDQGSPIVVWNDSRYGGSDTSIYAQRVDMAGKRYFPSYGTNSYWGLPVSVSTNYWSRQVAIAPRTNGVIATWADSRNGAQPDIYAQVIYKDGSLPVDLEQFTVRSARQGEADLVWKTVDEKNNAGFEIQRRRIDIASDNAWDHVTDYLATDGLRGIGNSSQERSYAYVDQGLEAGVYEYRLIDISFDGTRTAHEPKRVDMRNDLTRFSLGQNVPNPFSTRTGLPLVLPVDAIVDVRVADVTGRIVARPLAGAYLTAGAHEIAIDPSLLVADGNYIVTASASDPSTGAILWHSEKPVMLQFSR